MREGAPVEMPEEPIESAIAETESSPEAERTIHLIDSFSFGLLKKEIATHPSLVADKRVVGAAAEKVVKAIDVYSLFIVKDFYEIFPDLENNPLIQEALEEKMKKLMGILDSDIIKVKLLPAFPRLMENQKIFKIVADRLKAITTESVKEKMLSAYPVDVQDKLKQAMAL